MLRPFLLLAHHGPLEYQGLFESWQGPLAVQSTPHDKLGRSQDSDVANISESNPEYSVDSANLPGQSLSAAPDIVNDLAEGSAEPRRSIPSLPFPSPARSSIHIEMDGL